MAREKLGGVNQLLESFAYRMTIWTGSSAAFMIATGLTVLWLISGPFFQFSDTWQLVMNTVSSVVTFLMVFLFQRSQNKDGLAIQVKLNELIAAIHPANKRLIAVEELSEEEVRELHRRYQALADHAENAGRTTGHLSIESVPDSAASAG